MSSAFLDPYWMATLIGRPTESTKIYYDLKLHDDGFDDVAAELQARFSGLEIFGMNTLETLSHDLRCDGTGALNVIQARTTCFNRVEVKGYFAPSNVSELGARALAQSLRRSLPPKDGKALSAIPSEAGRLHDRFPIHYISVAYRPGLEVEMYHDAQTTRFGGDLAEILDTLRHLFGPGEWSCHISAALQICLDAGLTCTHASRDVHPAGVDGAITVFLDLPKDQDPRAAARSILNKIAKYADLTRTPASVFEKGHLSNTGVPFGLGLSARKDGVGGLALSLEEAAGAVLDRI